MHNAFCPVNASAHLHIPAEASSIVTSYPNFINARLSRPLPQPASKMLASVGRYAKNFTYCLDISAFTVSSAYCSEHSS